MISVNVMLYVIYCNLEILSRWIF